MQFLQFHSVSHEVISRWRSVQILASVLLLAGVAADSLWPGALTALGTTVWSEGLSTVSQLSPLVASLAFALSFTSAAAFVLWVRQSLLMERQNVLENHIEERTAEIEAQRRHALQQNKLLEMLVSGQPLGSILDEILNFAESESQGSGWVVLLRKKDKVQIAAAVNVPCETRKLLQEPKIVPFDAWHLSKYWASIRKESAWKGFADRAGEICPRAVYSRPIGAQDNRAGVLLVFPAPSNFSPEMDPNSIDVCSRLVRLASEHHMLNEDLRIRAHHDSLTGLPNRLLLQSRLEMAIGEASVSGEIVAVVVIDLDGLKQINVTHGQRSGDSLLQEMAMRLRHWIKPTDTLARLSGDDFAVVLRNLRNADEARALAEGCLSAIRQPFALQGNAVRTGASIGVATFPAEGADSEDLLRHADAAMNCAKSSGRDRVSTFSDTTDVLDRYRMQEAIREGLTKGHFQVHYQPKFYDEGRLAGFEALARFDHPKMGRVPPSAFIPAAEQSGLIVALGGWVLREVCRQIAAWRLAGLGNIPVAVNVSSLQLDKTDFALGVEKLLAEFQVSPECLELELTESLLISCTEDCHRQLRSLRNLGVKISIDDFGTGYSSLSYLHRLPVDAIKLDRSFVQSIDTDERARRLVQAMISVAQRLGLEVVAEGVEREEQREVLTASGCHLMQGYLFARPKPANELYSVLNARRQPFCDLLALSAATGTSVEFAPLVTTK